MRSAFFILILIMNIHGAFASDDLNVGNYLRAPEATADCEMLLTSIRSLDRIGARLERHLLDGRFQIVEIADVPVALRGLGLLNIHNLDPGTPAEFSESDGYITLVFHRDQLGLTFKLEPLLMWRELPETANPFYREVRPEATFAIHYEDDLRASDRFGVVLDENSSFRPFLEVQGLAAEVSVGSVVLGVQVSCVTTLARVSEGVRKVRTPRGWQCKVPVLILRSVQD